MESLPPSANWHLWPWCNFRCGYCFQPPAGILPLERSLALRVPGLLREAGVEKLTFVGGEPTLCPYLFDLVEEANRVGLVTMLVTNGSQLSAEDIAARSEILDWLCVSIDTFDAQRAAAIGRGDASSARHAEALLLAARRAGIRTKVNTVVSGRNWDDDLRDGIARISPDRWKVFRFLHVPETNDQAVGKFALADAQFAAFRERHAGLGAVFEENDDMTGSYVMLDAAGHFFQNGERGYVRSSSLFEVGAKAAFQELAWRQATFVKRGGLYIWTRTPPS